MVDFKQIPSPCYVLDEQLLRRNLEIIKSVKERAGIEIILALKGFAMWGAFPIIRDYINQATASSVNEAHLAFEELGSEAHTYSPAYNETDFEDIIRYSSHITFNSLSQLKYFEPKLKTIKRSVSVGLRVNPEYSEATADLYNPCSPGTRLGVNAEQLLQGLPEEVDGLHFHTLCEANSYSLEKTLTSFEERFGHLLSKVKWINMGGGHLMTRKDYDIEHLIKLLKNFKEKYDVKVILEPGSAFAWETGYLMSTILDIVENKGIKTAILDVSFSAHMPDCLEMPYKPRIIGGVDSVNESQAYRMGGNSCLAGDYIGNWSFNKDLKIGDKIIFEDMIHYTMVKTTTFNGINHPSIGIWNDESGFKLIKKFGYEDYKNRLS